MAGYDSGLSSSALPEGRAVVGLRGGTGLRFRSSAALVAGTNTAPDRWMTHRRGQKSRTIHALVTVITSRSSNVVTTSRFVEKKGGCLAEVVHQPGDEGDLLIGWLSSDLR